MASVLKAITLGLAFTNLAQSVMGRGSGNAIANASSKETCKIDDKRLLSLFQQQNFDRTAFTRITSGCPDGINQKIDGFPILSQAVMTGKDAVIEAALDAGAQIDAQDREKHTALHHAAMRGYESAIKILRARGANEVIRSRHGGTYMDYLRFIQPFFNRIPLNQTLFSAHKNEQHTYEAKCWNKGVFFVYENVATPTRLIDLLRTRKQFKTLKIMQLIHLPPLHDFFLERYEAYKQNPPILSVRFVTNKDDGTPINPDIKICGTFAEHPIPKGSIIAEYTGELTDRPKGDSTYLWSDEPAVDAISYRSAAAMVNDAFPNAAVVNLTKNKKLTKGLDGLPIRKMLIALEDINAGDQITLNYGSADPIKYSRHVELRPKTLIKFIQDNSWESLIASFKKFNQNDLSLEEKLDIFSKGRQFAYISDTPYILRILLEGNIIKQSDIERFESAAEDTTVLQVTQYYMGLINSRIAAIKNEKDEL